jgi:hypothetical protein
LGTEKQAAIFIGPEFGTVSRPNLVSAAKESGDAGFDVLITCAFNYDAHSSDFSKLGRIPSFQLHKLDKAKDPNFWSIRVGRDIRLIVHRTGTSLLLCYVNHHDQAYQWAERRRMETHPKTGAAQLVEIRERIEEIPKYVEVEQPAPPKPPVFKYISDGQFLAYGVPTEWLDAVRDATEDSLLEIAGHLPAEAAEALLNLATGIKPPLPEQVSAGTNPFEHPDALRRFRVMKNVEELALALEYPWERWAVFLHPAQRQLVQKDFNGPARVAGSAGTGKTIVALHRAFYLARVNTDARVLLTTFSDPLAKALDAKRRLLLTGEPRLGERIEVHSMDSIARRLFELNVGKANIATGEAVMRILKEAAASVDMPDRGTDKERQASRTSKERAV